ncbi:MAG: prepilin-type N-terminal cleavage/methylation domain-containing protein [Candidatus Margulisbacteria bacterium]|nr:prepilin-type N-terminal cleavage/methylation domain-containing protein [Candidatus Margulisiibacteriota bacterium]MBU1022264.1 prepilin-type N-terminal cleavage/methylation domain-containing protein [Candidatus Margulisiibacteriota bacterium]MBU1729297.1 prepilin-type N-terminal cleavage/methylation domain-containing protein [Candidatus Margulisiibacteriota bacterium]MBU1955570.1 prepilin-type N-terminal cleavage/methylation domain-containing protein [Candidatus Margulisiibacteriota bacteriu
MKKRGFTLIELVMVIVILGILAAIAIPRYVDLSSMAKLNATKASMGSIRAAVAVAYAEAAAAGTAAYPASITGSLFVENVVPTNQLTPSSNTVVGAYDGLGGWVYYSASGTLESNDAARTQM